VWSGVGVMLAKRGCVRDCSRLGHGRESGEWTRHECTWNGRWLSKGCFVSKDMVIWRVSDRGSVIHPAFDSQVVVRVNVGQEHCAIAQSGIAGWLDGLCGASWYMVIGRGIGGNRMVRVWRGCDLGRGVDGIQRG
jgi:hypothetical protein